MSTLQTSKNSIITIARVIEIFSSICLVSIALLFVQAPPAAPQHFFDMFDPYVKQMFILLWTWRGSGKPKHTTHTDPDTRNLNKAICLIGSGEIDGEPCVHLSCFEIKPQSPPPKQKVKLFWGKTYLGTKNSSNLLWKNGGRLWTFAACK